MSDNELKAANDKTGRTAMSSTTPSTAANRKKDRAARRAAMKTTLDSEYWLARKEILSIAEGGRRPPIHFDVRVISGELTVEKRYTLADVAFVDDIFSGERIATQPIVRRRTKEVSPDYIFERIMEIEQSNKVSPSH